jgi:hypothetical protein
VKRARLGGTYTILGSRGATPNEDDSFQFNFTSSDTLAFGYGNGNWKTTSQVFRDCSAWYHLTLAFDSTQATAANRIKLYVNGIQATSFTVSADPPLNLDSGINKTIEHRIGSYASAAPLTLDGYLADVFLIDGQALDPTSFGEFDDNGIWQPIDASGLTYGTNGFRLDFADNASTTTIGYDAAGSNDWTANNLSVTAGAGNDSLVDVPVNGSQTDTGAGGEVRGNYCTLNPLAKAANISVGNGNLQGSSAAFAPGGVAGTIAVSFGKWYWEVTNTIAGVGGQTYGIFRFPASGNYATGDNSSYKFLNNGSVRIGDGSNIAYGSTSWGEGDTIGVALDMDNGKVFFSINGTWQNSGDPAAGTNPAFSSLSGDFTCWYQDGGTLTDLVSSDFNFGQRPFAYTAPSGFKALNTANLPAPVVTKPSDLFDVKLYTGNGSTQTISGLGFSPDLVWIKNRAAADNHKLTDIVRGATEELESNTNDAEATNADGLTQFNADGFDLGDDDEYNTSSEAYVAWCWDAGSSTVTNTDGSISSQVRANASAGFSVVTYTGNGTNGATVGHGLGVTPSMIITKSRDDATNWSVYHSSLASTNTLFLNITNASTAAAGGGYYGTINSATYALTQGSINFFNVNNSGSDYVAYCFAPVAGYSSFGSYTGNGSADGPFVYLGFRPAVVIVKMSSSTGNWTILDSKREGYNVDNDPLYPNLASAEGTTDLIDITSNGFKVRTTDATFNTNAGTYVYAAWAESPFQYSRAR